MLVPLADIGPSLRVPGHPDRELELEWINGCLQSARGTVDGASLEFPILFGQPILIDFADSVVPREWFGPKASGLAVDTNASLARRLKGRLWGTEQLSRRNLLAFRDAARSRGADGRPLILLIGGGNIGLGTRFLYEDPDVDLVTFDIMPTEVTSFVADGHRIPLANESVDGVCVQAVLEHVLEPASVAAEIRRVLKAGGVVYAETPFMQQVHEGAYDFTRFTELGHRWLFKHFEPIERGTIGGPGLSLYWAARYFFRALTRSRWLSEILSLPFAIAALCDRFFATPDLIDGANGVFFLGRKSASSVSQGTLAKGYLGRQGTPRRGDG